MSKQIDFLKRCIALNLQGGGLLDLLDRIEELEREVERLKTTPPDKREDLRCVVSDLCGQVREARAERDALQADNARLLEALEDSYMTNPCDTNSQQKAFDKAQSALATTGDKHGS